MVSSCVHDVSSDVEEGGLLRAILHPVYGAALAVQSRGTLLHLCKYLKANIV